MSISRRKFFGLVGGAAAAAVAAPIIGQSAVVEASTSPVFIPSSRLDYIPRVFKSLFGLGTVTPEQAVAEMEALRIWGDGLHDDTAAIQALLDGGGYVNLDGGTYLVTDTLHMAPGTHLVGGHYLGYVNDAAVIQVHGGCSIQYVKVDLGPAKGNSTGIYSGDRPYEELGNARGKAGITIDAGGVEIDAFKIDGILQGKTPEDPDTVAMHIGKLTHRQPAFKAVHVEWDDDISQEVDPWNEPSAFLERLQPLHAGLLPNFRYETHYDGSLAPRWLDHTRETYNAEYSRTVDRNVMG